MGRYELAHRADGDLLDIYVYGIDRFGEAQDERYHLSLMDCFDLLAKNPQMGREALSVAAGLRRHEHGSHVILYEQTAYGVLILAIVHARSVRRLNI